MGYRAMPWLELTWVFLVVQTLIAMLTQFHRKDMVTITVCALGFHMLTYPRNVRRWQFRMLVAMIFLSIGQDLLWFALNRDVEDDDDDGGVEHSVKSFSRKMSYVSFIWRVSHILSTSASASLICFPLLLSAWTGSRPVERFLRLPEDRKGEEHL